MELWREMGQSTPSIRCFIGIALKSTNHLVCITESAIRIFTWKHLMKKRLQQLFSCEYYEIFKSTYFGEHLRTAVSDMTAATFAESCIPRRIQDPVIHLWWSLLWSASLYHLIIYDKLKVSKKLKFLGNEVDSFDFKCTQGSQSS